MWKLRGVLMAKQAKGSRDGDDEHELVAMARGLAEIVASHGLSELIVDTKETTLTIRRGGTAVAGPTPVPMSVALPSSALPHPAHAPLPVPVSAPAAVDDKAHVVTSPFVGTFYRKP